QIYVIQQGTVLLFDESGGDTGLRDVLGPGDLLGMERFNGAPACLYSVRSSSDVLIYAFPADAFEELVDRYPAARQFVDAHGSVLADYLRADARIDPRTTFLPRVVGARPL